MNKTLLQINQELIEYYNSDETIERGFINETQKNKILEITGDINLLNPVELQNLRDFTVMFMSQQSQTLMENDAFTKGMKIHDCMSALTHIIDIRKFEMGLEV